MKRECESCIKRKTTYCPTSMECMATDDMPYYQNRIMLLKENEELKKQVEEYKDKINWYENFEINKTIDELRIKHNNQQKEFISYLEKTIEELESDNVDDEEMKGYLIQRINTFKEILQKYKDIIGDDK